MEVCPGHRRRLGTAPWHIEGAYHVIGGEEFRHADIQQMAIIPTGGDGCASDLGTAVVHEVFWASETTRFKHTHASNASLTRAGVPGGRHATVSSVPTPDFISRLSPLWANVVAKRSNV